MRKLFFLFCTAFTLTALPAAIYGQETPETCCETCSCTLCGNQLACYGLYGIFGPSDVCNDGGEGNCGFGNSNGLCTTWWQNSTLTGTDRGDGASTDCIPIDGGLGFLIAGALGMGVFCIRRREDGIGIEA